jgi:adenylate kinase
MYLVLLGAPGAGKGTQAETLVKTFGLAHIATGDLFRENVANGTELGLQAKSYMDRGTLVPDDITVRMLLERLAQPDTAKGVMFDGFPRTIQQAEALAAALARQGKKVNRVLYIKVPNEVLIERLSGRLTCRVCGAVYHVKFAPPRVPGICDKCGGELYQRPDDTVETVRKRLDVYFAQTSPLIDYYTQRNLLTEINGDQDVQAVGEEMIRAVKAIADCGL